MNEFTLIGYLKRAILCVCLSIALIALIGGAIAFVMWDISVFNSVFAMNIVRVAAFSGLVTAILPLDLHARPHQVLTIKEKEDG